MGYSSHFGKLQFVPFGARQTPFCTAKQLNVLRSHGQNGRASLEGGGGWGVGGGKLISLFKSSQKPQPQ